MMALRPRSGFFVSNGHSQSFRLGIKNMFMTNRSPRSALKISFSLIFGLLAPVFAQDIVIEDRTVNAHVFGNGNPPDGTALATWPDYDAPRFLDQ